ncbi:hypothetical protein CEY12_07090 [Chryseobacterium sp. T16E-39]|uniref:DUF1062 domain-containing protein n=1 Tax=Chryseobacterium sp. T16E-39 TaxID=2015076 RepID=UPI000B5B27A9|nr:DUF1062 domain-containing protein [Chryseobacterium sp. T16E-39]ASK32706.1 hypothetical protein CEY12_07090 [Chryseobacterium sp. T16E-39]
MRQEHIWEVQVKNTPLLKRKCNHCDSNRYYCSEKFRMNAQKKNIDVWLIYRCVKCDNTYNLSLFSRIRTESISPDLFDKLSGNNKEIARGYAFSYEIMRKNNIEMDLDTIEYDIQHTAISIDDILNSNHTTVLFKIKYPFDFSLKLSTLIRICLQLSASQLNKLITAKAILVQERHLLKKHKIKNGDIIQIDRDKLRGVFVI